MSKMSLAVSVLLLAVAGGRTATVTSVSQWGITWTFDKAYEAGNYINGDWWVVGPVTVVSVSPGWDGEKNGSMVNPAVAYSHGYDSRTPNFKDSLRTVFPVTLTADKSLVSSVGLSTYGGNQWAALQTASILTVVSSPPEAGSFRPHYSTAAKQGYTVDRIAWDKLPGLSSPIPALTPDGTGLINSFNHPWLDHVPSWNQGVIHPADNMEDYGRDISTKVSVMSQYVMLDVPDLDRAMYAFLQVGIDLYGLLLSGRVWEADGGIELGRKWPILFAGIMLGDSAMMNIGKNYDPITFQEDCTTFYVSQAEVDITNSPAWAPDDRITDNEPYTVDDIGLPEWGIRHCYRPTIDTKAWGNYRICCTSKTWPGAMLAALMLDARDLWNHNPFFDYIDRWVTQSGDYGSSFVQAMWQRYRDDLPATGGVSALPGSGRQARGTERTAGLNVYPLPTTGSVTFNLHDANGAGIRSVAIYGLGGNIITSWTADRAGDAAAQWVWDGKDRQGKYIESGRYYYSVQTGTGTVNGMIPVME